MKSSTTISSVALSLPSQFALAVISVAIAAIIGFAAEKSQPRLDRFGDPLPPRAIRRFGTIRFRHARMEDVAFTPDGKRLIAGIGKKPLSVFDAMTGRKLRDVGKSTSSGVLGGFAVSPDGKWVASCGEDVY